MGGLRVVGRVVQDGVDELVHGCDAGAARNHANVGLQVGLVVELDHRPAHGVAHGE